VARLYEVVTRRQRRTAGISRALPEPTLLDQPWADPTIPSRVHVENGEIVGFIGTNIRRMRFVGERITMACNASFLSPGIG
jgi:hypothetical protein